MYLHVGLSQEDFKHDLAVSSLKPPKENRETETERDEMREKGGG